MFGALEAIVKVARRVPTVVVAGRVDNRHAAAVTEKKLALALKPKNVGSCALDRLVS